LKYGMKLLKYGMKLLKYGMKLLKYGMKLVERVLERRMRALMNLDNMQFGFMPR